MTALPEKECPLCITTLTDTEYEFYPCPCGYQICSYCFTKIVEELTKLCPSCRRPFDPDASKRIGKDFRPVRTESAPVAPVPVSYFAGPKIVQIVGIPDDFLSSDILRQNRFLGQYGTIKKMSIDPSTVPPSSKCLLQGQESSVFVKFATKEEAATCALALDGFTISAPGVQTTIRTSISIVEKCTRAKCAKRNCMKRHRNKKETDVLLKAEDIEHKLDKLKRHLRIQKPANYNSYPKRSTGFTVFPAPRLVPAANSNFPFQITKCYAQKPPMLMDLVSHPDGIPQGPHPKTPAHQTITSLATVFRMNE